MPHELPYGERRKGVTFTRNQIVGYLLLVWLTSIIASTGVSVLASSFSTDRANDGIAELLRVQRDQGRAGLSLIYTNDKARCDAAVPARMVQIANAQAQRAYYAALAHQQAVAGGPTIPLPNIRVPKPAKPCSESVKNPNTKEEP